MSNVLERLENMSDVNDMWNLFVIEIKAAINDLAPKKLIVRRSLNEPVWFNKKAKRLVAKQRKTYNAFKAMRNPFYKK